jgi:hypothetical protein
MEDRGRREPVTRRAQARLGASAVTLKGGSASDSFPLGQQRLNYVTHVSFASVAYSPPLNALLHHPVGLLHWRRRVVEGSPRGFPCGCPILRFNP